MNKNKEIMKLAIYITVIILTIVFWFIVREASRQVWTCITAPCPKSEPQNMVPYTIGCIIVSGIFTILSIKTIIKIKRK